MSLFEMRMSLVEQTVFVSPDPKYVWGFDSSHWDGVLDLSNTFDKGMRFAIYKCVDGTVSTNYFLDNYPNSVNKGLISGAYAWLYPDKYVNAKSQAQATWNRIKNLTQQLPVTIDFEWTNYSGNPANPNYNDLDIWVTEFTRLSGYKPMLYSAAGYMNGFGEMPSSLKNKFSAFWFANYGVSKPTLPIGFSHWDFWQYTSSLSQDYWCPSSINKKELDGNYFYSTLDDLYALAGTNPAEPPEPPNPPPDIESESVGEVITEGLNIRSGGGTTYSVLGTAKMHDLVYGSVDEASGWFHLFAWYHFDSGAVDMLDGWCSAYSDYLSIKTAPPSDVESHPFDGVTTYSGTRNGYKFWLDIIEPSKVTYKVVHPSPLTVGTNIDGDIVYNGGEWDKVSMPKDYSVSDGNVYVQRKEAVPSLMVLETGQLAINHQNIVGTKQAISGLRYILENGEIPSYLYGTEPKYTEGHSRSIHGLKLDGTHMVLTSEGVYPNQGLTLLQDAEIMKEYNCFIAFDSGGGGDVTRVVNGQLTNKPEDISGGVNVQRHLPQFLSITIKESGGGDPIMGDIKLINNSGETRKVRRDPPSGKAHVYGSEFAYIYNNYYAIANADDAYTYTQDIFNSNGDMVARAGDIWDKVREIYNDKGVLMPLPLDSPTDANGKYGWTARIHKGQPQLDVETIAPPPSGGVEYPDVINGTEEMLVNGEVVATYDVVKTKRV